jgi:hypothetical protein
MKLSMCAPGGRMLIARVRPLLWSGRDVWLVFVVTCLAMGLVSTGTAKPDAFDRGVNGDATGPYAAGWFGLNSNVGLPGDAEFCLSLDEGRVVTNLSDPLYLRPLTLMYDGAPGLSNAFEYIIKLLAQEILGYRVLHYLEDATAPTNQVGTSVEYKDITRVFTPD